MLSWYVRNSKVPRLEAKHNNKKSSIVHKHYLTKKIKNKKYNEILKETSNNFGLIDKNFSRIIHLPLIEKPTEFISATFMRPLSTTIGIIFSIVLYILSFFVARKYGFTISNILPLFLFMIGYVLGIFIELLLFAYKRIYQKS